MKILELPAYFDPENAAGIQLINDCNKTFVEGGFRIEVFTPEPTRGISFEIRRQYKRKRFEEQYYGFLKVHRFPMFRESNKSVIRAFRYILCSFIQFIKGCYAEDINVIFVTSTPPIQGAMAAMLKKVKKVPFVYCLQDVFPDSLIGTRLTQRGSLVWKVGRWIENFTYNNADTIIVISQDFKRNIIAKGVPEEKIVVIYNWVDEDTVINVDRADNKLFNRYNLNRRKFYVTYCGNLGLTQNLDMLLEVAKELHSIEDIHFVLIGEGVYKETLKGLIAKGKIKNVKLIPFQSYEDISHVFSLGDVGLVISKPGVGENSLPSKTWSIMSASRPVLASFDENELKEIIEGNRCGIFTKAGNKNEFKNAIMTLYNNPDECRMLGINGRKFILENLTRAKSTSKYIEAIRKFDY